MDKNNIELIKEAISGDKISLIELIKQEENNIYSTLYYLKQNDDEIADIMQNVLLKLSTKIHQLKNPKYFSTWLNQIIINSYYDYLRKRKRSSQLILSDKESDFDTVDYKTNPQDKILYSELDRVIKNSIKNLPMHYKIPIALREIQGLSYSDISNITKTTVGTVKSRIARARSIIKDKVDKYTKG